MRARTKQLAALVGAARCGDVRVVNAPPRDACGDGPMPATPVRRPRKNWCAPPPKRPRSARSAGGAAAGTSNHTGLKKDVKSHGLAGCAEAPPPPPPPPPPLLSLGPPRAAASLPAPPPLPVALCGTYVPASSAAALTSLRWRGNAARASACSFTGRAPRASRPSTLVTLRGSDSSLRRPRSGTRAANSTPSCSDG
eukprot:320909-Chlamydomonas_euryale.AAC.7